MVVLCSIVMSVYAFHAANRGSILSRRAQKFSFQLSSFTFKTQRNFLIHAIVIPRCIAVSIPACLTPEQGLLPAREQEIVSFQLSSNIH